VKIILATIVTAFSPETIGTKVTDPAAFLAVLEKAVQKHNFMANRVPGQGFIDLPEAVPFISSGIGKRLDNPEAYVARSYRGRVDAYLKRAFAEPATGCAAIVYSFGAYAADPDVSAKETARARKEEATHILVAVLSFTAAGAAYGAHRFVANLAGGNKEALTWTADEIRQKAVETNKFETEWAVVAD
jgi:hypothetical protein